MRRAVLILLLGIGCASSGPREQMVSVDLLEQTKGHRIALIGTHLFVVRVHNVSEQAITVESINLALVATTELQLQDSTQSFQTTMEPGETRDFEMWVTVVPTRNTAQTYLPNIDSLSVTVAYGANGKDFIDSGVHVITGLAS